MREAKKSGARRGKVFAALVTALALAQAAAGQGAAMSGTFKPVSGATSPYVLNDPANWEEGAVPSGPGSTAYLTTTATTSYKFTADFPTSEEGAHVFGSLYGHPSSGNCNLSQSVSGTKLKFDAGEGGWSVIDGYQQFSLNDYSVLSPLWVKAFRLDFDGSYISGTGIGNGVKLSRTQLKYGNKTEGGILGPISGKGMINREFTQSSNEGRPEPYFAGDYSWAGNVAWALSYGAVRIAPGSSGMELNGVAAGVPEEGLTAHFDANELVELRAGKHLARWISKVPKSGEGGGILALPLEGAVTPMLRENEIGPAALIDLQGWNPRFASGMAFEQPVEGVRTVVALIDTTNCGEDFLAGTDGENLFQTEAEVRINGRELRKDLGEFWNDGGLNIVSFTRPEGEAMPPAISGFGYKNTGVAASGGMMLGEVMMWNRRLGATELAAVEKHLYLKWLKDRTALRSITALGEITLNIEASGAKASVDNFTGNGQICKNGEGTLRISKPRGNLIPLRIAGGTVEVEDLPAANFVGADPNATYPQAGLVFHVDASKSGTIDRDERNIISEWRDAEGRTDAGGTAYRAFASEREGCHPPIYRGEGINGQPAVDFGPGNRLGTLQFSHELTVRTAVYVGSHQGGGRLLFGKYGAGNDLDVAGEYDVQRVNYSDILGVRYMNARAKWNTARIWSDGKERRTAVKRKENNSEVELLDPVYSGDMQVMAVQSAYPNGAGFTADTFCYGPIINASKGLNWNKCGGLKLAEALFYDRVLTEDELAAAQAYLHNKWMKNDTRSHLPTVEMAGDGAIASEGDITTGTVSGSGKLTKKGAGVLKIGNIAPGFRGKFASTEGAISLPTAKRTSAVQLPGPQPKVWFDSSAEGTVATNEAGQVTAWTSRAEGTAAVIAAPAEGSGTATFKRDTVNHGGAVWNKHAVFTSHNEKALVFDQELEGLQTMIIVYRHDGGEHGRVLNSSDSAWDRHRWPLLWATTDSAPALRNSRIWLDGGELPAMSKILGGYHIVTVNPLSPVKVNAFGRCHTYAEMLAYDRELTGEERRAVEAYLAAKWWGKPLHDYAPAGWSEANCNIAGGEMADDVTYHQEENATNTVGALTGGGALGKAGPGVMVLKGDMSGFSGRLTVKAGELAYAEGAGAAGASGAVRVEAGAKFCLNGATHTAGGLEIAGGEVKGGTLNLAEGATIRFGAGTPMMTVESLNVLGGGTLMPDEPIRTPGDYPVIKTEQLNGAGNFPLWTTKYGEGQQKMIYRLVSGANGVVSVRVSGNGFTLIVR